MVWRVRAWSCFVGAHGAAPEMAPQTAESESDVRHLGPHWEDNFWTIFGLELDGTLPEALEGGYEHGVEGMNCFWMSFGLEVGLAGGCITDLFERCQTSRYG